MANTIEHIKEKIEATVKEQLPELARSAASRVAEWKLWTYIVAVAIHAFELIMDNFQKEITALTTRITPGTVRWYAEMCKRFQNGNSLSFDESTGLLYYKEDFPESSRIIKNVAISEGVDEDEAADGQPAAGVPSGRTCLHIKVAKEENGKIVELSPEELRNFEGYIDAIKFAGCQTKVISTKADRVYYKLTVYHDPAVANDIVRDNVKEALKDFKVSIDFDGILYRQKFLDAVMAVNGVVTCVLDDFKQHSSRDVSEDDWHHIDTHAELEAGYFDYADGSVGGLESVLTITPINNLLQDKTAGAPSDTPNTSN